MKASLSLSHRLPQGLRAVEAGAQILFTQIIVIKGVFHG